MRESNNSTKGLKMETSMEIEEPIITGELRQEIMTIEERTKNISVCNAIERTEIYNLILMVKAKKKSVVDFFSDMKDKAFKAHRAIVSAEKAETDKLDAFEIAGKRAIMAYDKIEEDKRIAEQKRLQAEADEKARRERAKIEAEVTRQRAIQAEAEAKAAEAFKAAETASNEEKRRLLKIAQAAEVKAEIAEAKADVKTETAAAISAPIIEVAKVMETPKGQSVRQIWKFRVIDSTLIPREYLSINEMALNAFAKATKGAVKLPGVEFYAENSMAMRA